MTIRITFLLSALTLLDPAFATPPAPVRVYPNTLPAHILVEITGTGCSRNEPPGYEGIWYATVKAKVTDIEPDNTYITAVLRDPETDIFLFNPGTRHQIEGGYLLNSVAFNERILDQIVFEFREGMKAVYEIYLRDFHSAESC